MKFLVPLSLCLALGVDSIAPYHVEKGALSRSARNPPTIAIQGASLTSKWFEGSNEVQIIELTLANTGSTNWLNLADTLQVTASGDVQLVTPGTLKRLRPGQSAIVQVGVKNKAGIAAGATCSVTISASWGGGYGVAQTATSNISGRCGFGNYTADTTSLGWHMTPQWYDDAKFGIFIHWGLYSIPAYGGLGKNENYAEWYWHNMNSPGAGSNTYGYHEKTYGKNFAYDDFMSEFTGAGFNAKAWVQLIATAGAQYLVPVTKHHDGFALFNFSTAISTRSSVHYGPKRDFIGELLTAAKQYQPHLRRGTYFSMPEWYNPAYTKYANGVPGFPGGPTQNPYTQKTTPYTGYVTVSDFVSGIQYPQMQALAYNYDTELMWCDIGGANNMKQFASEWLNWARGQGRQVTYNNRCGSGGDFTTPEYAKEAKTTKRKWESNRGMDPYSFGYNFQTPDADYQHGIDIVIDLVDIVSKNGNFLLDIGPKGDGSIPQIMQTGLTDAGSWITTHSEAIYKTKYWSQTSGINNIRYTTTNDAFYIHVLSNPGTSVSLPDPIPYLPGDSVTVVGGSKNGAVVNLVASGTGYKLQLDSSIAGADRYVWTFKITYLV